MRDGRSGRHLKHNKITKYDVYCMAVNKISSTVDDILKVDGYMGVGSVRE